MSDITRPDTEQIYFRSSRTGLSVLDAYLEAAEIGNRPLAALMSELFDSVTGKVRSGLVQFRLNPTTRELESRAGVYSDPESGWGGTSAFFSRVMGDWATGVQYRSSDYVRIAGVTYITTADHVSGATPDMAKFVDLLASPTLAAISAATGAGADTFPYFTGATTAAYAAVTATGRAILAGASAAAVRTTLGLGAASTASLTAWPATKMAGGATLTLDADPLLAKEAATKGYVDARVATKADPLGYTPVNKNGDTMTGFLSLHAKPTGSLHAATKGYVDDALVVAIGDKVSKAGDTMSGALALQNINVSDDTKSLSLSGSSTGATDNARITLYGPTYPTDLKTIEYYSNRHTFTNAGGPGGGWQVGVGAQPARIYGTRGIFHLKDTAFGVDLRLSGNFGGDFAITSSGGVTYLSTASADTANAKMIFAAGGTSFATSVNKMVVSRDGIFDGGGNELGYKGVPMLTYGTPVVLDTSHRGKMVSAAATTVTIPSGVFSAGDTISVIASGGAGVPSYIASGAGLTAFLVGTGVTGTRTLAGNGIATIFMYSPTIAVISGAGLS